MIPDNLLSPTNDQKRLPSYYGPSDQLHMRFPLFDEEALQINKQILTGMHFHEYPAYLSIDLIATLTFNHTINRLAELGASPVHMRFAIIVGDHHSENRINELMKLMENLAVSNGISISFNDMLMPDIDHSGWVICAEGLGAVHTKSNLSTKRITAGDKLIISSEIGDHGLTMKNYFQELDHQYDLDDHHYPSHLKISSLLNDLGGLVKFIKMPFEGLENTITEVSNLTGLKVDLFQSKLPMKEHTKHIAYLNDIDPLQLGNEGVFLCVVGYNKAHLVVNKLKTFTHGRNASIIGEVTSTLI